MKFVVLEDKKLKYYTNENCDKIEGCIDFDKVSCKLRIETKSNPKQFTVQMLGKGDQQKDFIFQAASPKDLHSWVEVINIHLNAS